MYRKSFWGKTTPKETFVFALIHSEMCIYYTYEFLRPFDSLMILRTSAAYCSDSNNAFLPPLNQRFLLHMAVEGALT